MSAGSLRWRPLVRLASHPPACRRTFSSDTQHVSVRCASSGHITVSLYNEPQHRKSTPLLLYLPPSAAAEPPPPAFLLRQQLCPVAAVHYRWCVGGTETETEDRDRDRDRDRDHRNGRPPPASHPWPTPLHDVLFAYDWLRRHLHRRVLVYGEGLGAGLATTLALTEAFPTWRNAVHGLAAYDGIYNWSAFYMSPEANLAAMDALVADIQDYAAAVTAAAAVCARVAAAATTTTSSLGLPSMETLFSRPADLLDQFASPSLFFQTPGELVLPSAFPGQKQVPGTDASSLFVTPRRAGLRYPPAASLLRIPATLLLHANDGQPTSAHSRAKRRLSARTTVENNSYAAQAAELAGLMRRSHDRQLQEERRREEQNYQYTHDDHQLQFREDDAEAADEGERHVRLLHAGRSADGGIDHHGQNALLSWLEEQVRLYERLQHTPGA